MTVSIDAPVGLRNRTQMVTNKSGDQQTIIDALSAIPPTSGGKKGIWLPKPASGPDRSCQPILANGIWDFQNFWKRQGQFKVIDGVVDPIGHTINKLSELAPSDGPAPAPTPNDNRQTINGFGFRQTNPPGLTQVHTVSNPVIRPLTMMNRKLEVFQLETRCREFLFEINKNGNIFWVGACVPDGTFDFTRVQVFFHPTVKNGQQVHADDRDYPTFTGGWSGSIQRYVAMEGGQLAAARLCTMIVPFMTMASGADTASTSMWADEPVATLNAIMWAIEREMSPNGIGLELQVSQVGLASFSSGYAYMRDFIGRVKSSGLIREVNDFDSVLNKHHPQQVPNCAGAVCRLITQKPTPHGRAIANWVFLSPDRFSNISNFKHSVHAQIGWMMYYSTMLGSVIL